MTKDKCYKVVGIYREKLGGNTLTTAEKVKFSQYNLLLPQDRAAGLVHCCQMLDQMEKFIEEDRMDKFFRWLGFIQGALWALGVYTVADLKGHSKPDEEGDVGLSLEEIIKDGTMNDPC